MGLVSLRGDSELKCDSKSDLKSKYANTVKIAKCNRGVKTPKTIKFNKGIKTAKSMKMTKNINSLTNLKKSQSEKTAKSLNKSNKTKKRSTNKRDLNIPKRDKSTKVSENFVKAEKIPSLEFESRNSDNLAFSQILNPDSRISSILGIKHSSITISDDDDTKTPNLISISGCPLISNSLLNLVNLDDDGEYANSVTSGSSDDSESSEYSTTPSHSTDDSDDSDDSNISIDTEEEIGDLIAAGYSLSESIQMYFENSKPGYPNRRTVPPFISTDNREIRGTPELTPIGSETSVISGNPSHKFTRLAVESICSNASPATSGDFPFDCSPTDSMREQRHRKRLLDATPNVSQLVGASSEPGNAMAGNARTNITRASMTKGRSCPRVDFGVGLMNAAIELRKGAIANIETLITPAAVTDTGVSESGCQPLKSNVFEEAASVNTGSMVKVVSTLSELMKKDVNQSKSALSEETISDGALPHDKVVSTVSELRREGDKQYKSSLSKDMFTNSALSVATLTELRREKDEQYKNSLSKDMFTNSALSVATLTELRREKDEQYKNSLSKEMFTNSTASVNKVISTVCGLKTKVDNLTKYGLSSENISDCSGAVVKVPHALSELKSEEDNQQKTYLLRGNVSNNSGSVSTVSELRSKVDNLLKIGLSGENVSKSTRLVSNEEPTVSELRSKENNHVKSCLTGEMRSNNAVSLAKIISSVSELRRKVDKQPKSGLSDENVSNSIRLGSDKEPTVSALRSKENNHMKSNMTGEKRSNDAGGLPEVISTSSELRKEVDDQLKSSLPKDEYNRVFPVITGSAASVRSTSELRRAAGALSNRNIVIIANDEDKNTRIAHTTCSEKMKSPNLKSRDPNSDMLNINNNAIQNGYLIDYC